MTPREILAKYELKTDVKSIRERLEKDRYIHNAWEKRGQGSFGVFRDHECASVERESTEIRTADLDLLCEMAEKVEKIAIVCDNWFHAIDALHRIEEILKGEKE